MVQLHQNRGYELRLQVFVRFSERVVPKHFQTMSLICEFIEKANQTRNNIFFDQGRIDYLNVTIDDSKLKMMVPSGDFKAHATMSLDKSMFAEFWFTFDVK